MPTTNRRRALTGGIAAAGALLLATRVAASTRRSKFKAIAFDAFPVFDPRPVATLCEALFPGRGGELVNLWRLRQFEYTWLRTAETATRISRGSLPTRWRSRPKRSSSR